MKKNSSDPRMVRVDAWEINVPLLHEWIASPEFGGSHPHGHDRVIVRLTDGDGFTGWGEMSYEGKAESLEGVARLLLGTLPGAQRTQMLDLHKPGQIYWNKPAAPSPYAAPLNQLQHRVRHRFQMAFETALVDLMGRRAGVPMNMFFGGAWRDRVHTDYWMGRMTPEHAARCVKRGLSLGFTGIKLKTTLEDPNVERLEAIKEAAGGDHFKVTVDPNGRFYRLDDAWPTIAAMDCVGNMGILEDPFPRFHLGEFAALRPRINARVVVHLDPIESMDTVLKSGAAGGLNIDSHTQGLFNWRASAGAAFVANLPIWHGSGIDLGIYTAAQLHLACSAPNCPLPGDQVGPWLREATLLKQAFVVEEGCVRVPAGAGLGVEVDMDAVEKYAIGTAGWSV